MSDNQEFVPGTLPIVRLDSARYRRAVHRAYDLMNLGEGDDRRDASEVEFMARSLTEVEARALEKRFPSLVGRSLVPLKPSSEGAQYHTFREKTDVGSAALISNYADDLPSVSGYESETGFGFAAYGASYNVSVQDLRAARHANQPLDSADAERARKVIERQIDSAIMLGEPKKSGDNFKGLAKLSGITPLAAGTAWATATAQQIVADLAAMYNKLLVDTNGVVADMAGGKLTLAVGTAQYSALTKPIFFGSGDGAGTIWNLVKASCPWLDEVFHSVRLNGAAPAAKDRTILLPRDPDVLYTKIPIDFYAHAPQARNLAFVTNCESRFGGVVVVRQKMIAYLDQP